MRKTGKLDLLNPFNSYVSKQIIQISYFTFGIGIISYVARQTSEGLLNYGFNTTNLNQFWTDSQAFILMAAVIFVIASIFKRGIELQKENDMTV